jgi:hypothetical protein
MGSRIRFRPDPLQRNRFLVVLVQTEAQHERTSDEGFKPLWREGGERSLGVAILSAGAF